MKVSECMTSNVEVGTPNMSLFEVAKKMRDGNFGALPIGEYDRLIGMITDRDLAIRGMAEGLDPKKTRARDIMTKHIRYCFEDQSLEEVAEELGSEQIRRLVVLNRDKRLVGILSLGDLAQSLEHPDNLEETLTKISKPACGMVEPQAQI